jgi:nucleoside 2-deoxyribosyltransferase
MSCSFSKKIYISGPLQAAIDLAAARGIYEAAADACRRAGWDAYLPHQATDPIADADVSSRAVFARDLNQVAAADAILAFIGAPSSGVGAELGIAYAADKPVIGVYFSSERPSRFILGMLDSTDFPEPIKADSWVDAEPKVLERLASIERRLGNPPLAVR